MIKKFFFPLFVLISITCGFCLAQDNNPETTVKNFFDALIKRDIVKQEKCIFWENFSWGDGVVGILLKAGYKNASEAERKDTRKNFLKGFNSAFLEPREEKLNRKMRLDDFQIVSTEKESENNLILIYNEPFAKGKKIFLENNAGVWLIVEIEKAAEVQP